MKRQSLFLLVIAFTASALANYTSSFTMEVRPEWPASAGDRCGTTGLNLTGEGQLLTTADSGIDTGDLNTLHADLRDNVIGFAVSTDWEDRWGSNYRCSPTDLTGHGTHTAGSIVGTGAQSEGQFKGMAYRAKLWAWFVGSWDGAGVCPPLFFDNAFRPERQSSYANCGMVSHIYSASYGSVSDKSAEGHSLYTTYSQDIDEYCWLHPDFLPCWAAGNDGDVGLVFQGTSKNALVVGASDGSGIAYFSSLGPTKDGRTKPDICAPGTSIASCNSTQCPNSGSGSYRTASGTSMATPLTAGVCALIREWLIKYRGFDDAVTNKKPTSALMKAVIMGGAVNLGLDKNAQGAGRVNLASSVAPEDGRKIYLKDRIPFAEDKQTVFTFTTTEDKPLDAQLVWVDYPGTPNSITSTPMLVNDLDLSLIKWDSQVNQQDSSFDMCYGNGGDDFDRLNNAESIHLNSLPAGTYKLVVASENIQHPSTEGGAAALYLKGAFDDRAISVRDKLEDTHPVKIIVR